MYNSFVKNLNNWMSIQAAIELENKCMREIDFVSPLKGYLIPLEEVKDEAISQKMLGNGFAIIPSHNEIVSPVNGKIIALYPTGHAIGIRTEEGYEILIHFGVNTFQLKGEGIEIHINDGQEIKQNELLIRFDPKRMEQNEVDTTTSILFVNREEIALKRVHEEVTTHTRHIFDIGDPNEII